MPARAKKHRDMGCEYHYSHIIVLTNRLFRENHRVGSQAWFSVSYQFWLAFWFCCCQKHSTNRCRRHWKMWRTGRSLKETFNTSTTRDPVLTMVNQKLSDIISTKTESLILAIRIISVFTLVSTEVLHPEDLLNVVITVERTAQFHLQIGK